MHLEKSAADVVEVLSLREKTKKDYLSALNCHVFPQLGKMEITLITKSDIQQVVHELDPPIAAKTLAVLKTVFREAIDSGHMEFSPTIGVRTKPMRTVPRKFLRWEEIKTSVSFRLVDRGNFPRSALGNKCLLICHERVFFAIFRGA